MSFVRYCPKTNRINFFRSKKVVSFLHSKDVYYIKTVNKACPLRRTENET